MVVECFIELQGLLYHLLWYTVIQEERERHYHNPRKFSNRYKFCIDIMYKSFWSYLFEKVLNILKVIV